MWRKLGCKNDNFAGINGVMCMPEFAMLYTYQ